MKKMKMKKVNDKVHQILKYGGLFYRRVDIKEVDGISKCRKCDFDRTCQSTSWTSGHLQFKDDCNTLDENKGKVLKRCNIKVLKIGLIERLKQLFN